MERTCHRPHEMVIEPLLTVNRYREDYAPGAVPIVQGVPPNPILASKAKPTLAGKVDLTTWA